MDPSNVNLDGQITVVTPAVPPRVETGMLQKAVRSVVRQTERPKGGHIVIVDVNGEGEAVTRNRGLAAVTTEWTAFLDDDDYFLPQHLELLLRATEETDADLIYPYFDLKEGEDPFKTFGIPMSPDRAVVLRDVVNFIPVTYLVRTSLAKEVGGFPLPDTEEWPRPDAVDWGFHHRLLAAGARYYHLPEVTWVWRHWAGNLSGRTWTEVPEIERPELSPYPLTMRPVDADTIHQPSPPQRHLAILGEHGETIPIV